LLYSEVAMREVRDMEGIDVNEENINNIRYADDTALIADSESKVQDIVGKIVTESEKLGLALNVKTASFMDISKKKEAPKRQLIVNEQVIKQVKQFCYLGTIITSHDRCDTEIKRRNSGKGNFQRTGKYIDKQKGNVEYKKKNIKLLCMVNSFKRQ